METQSMNYNYDYDFIDLVGVSRNDSGDNL